MFLSLFILNGQHLMQFNSALLSCSPIVISILTFLHEIFELIKMMMMILMMLPKCNVLTFFSPTYTLIFVQLLLISTRVSVFV